MILSIFGAFLAALGFGVIFNVHGKALIAAAIGGTIGYVCYELQMMMGSTNIVSLFISSMIFSIFGEICARKLKMPVTVFLIIALIILVPGKGMYYTMLEIIQGNSNQAMLTGIDTFASAGALALGTIFVSTFTKLLFKKRVNHTK
ncbi:threonine/serine exporter family protein [Anaerorhabdus sp.]|uniref:threonine/serine exporter family protein n=1 Tax=Anaerorhabdus sp. TaxID=1872524 RepID=UPI002FC5F929